MQLAPATLKQEVPMAHRGDCLKCNLCVASCPTAALAFWEGSTDKSAA